MNCGLLEGPVVVKVAVDSCAIVFVELVKVVEDNKVAGTVAINKLV